MESLDRRAFLEAAAASALALGADQAAQNRPGEEVAAPAVARGTFTLRLAMPWPDALAGFGGSAFRLARRIELLSAGRFRVALEPAAAEDIAVCAEGRADIFHGFEQAQAALDPAFAWFAGLPGREEAPGDPAGHEAWLLVGGGQELWDELAARFGTKPLMAGASCGPGVWSSKAITCHTDLAGEPILSQGLLRQVIRRLGGVPLDAPVRGWAEALAAGRATAASLGELETNMALGLGKCARVILSPGFTLFQTAALHVQKALWDSFEEADRAVFIAAAGQEVRLTLAERQAHGQLLRTALERSHGVVFHRESVDRDDRPVAGPGAHENFTVAVREVIRDAAASSTHAARIAASYAAFRDAMLTGVPRPLS